MTNFERCSGRADFESLSHSRRINGETLWLRGEQDSTLERARVAFAVSTHYGKAVQRNRLRRQLRVALNEMGDRLMPGRYLIGTRGRAGERSAAGRAGTRSAAGRDEPRGVPAMPDVISPTAGISYRTVLAELETMLAELETMPSKLTKKTPVKP